MLSPAFLAGFPAPGGGEGLVHDGFPHLRILLQELRELFLQDAIHQGTHLAVAQLVLGLALELGVGELDGDDRGHPLPAVLPGEALPLLQQAGLLSIGVDHPGEGGLEARFVHAASGGVDVVGKGIDDLIIAVVPLEGDLRLAVLPDAGDIDHVLVQGLLRPVQVGDEFPDASLIAHGVPPGFLRKFRALGPFVKDGDAQARVQEGLLPHTDMEGLIVVYRILEHLGIRLEAHGGAGTVGLADDLHILGLVAPAELHLVDLSAPVDLHLQPFGKGVHYAGAHAVKAAGYLVASAAELAAGVEDGVHHLQGGLPRLLLHVHGDAPAVVLHPDHVPRLDGHRDVVTEARQGLVDGVGPDLVHPVVRTAGAGGADVHARTKTNRLQTLQYLDLRGVIGFRVPVYFRFLVGIH